MDHGRLLLDVGNEPSNKLLALRVREVSPAGKRCESDVLLVSEVLLVDFEAPATGVVLGGSVVPGADDSVPSVRAATQFAPGHSAQRATSPSLTPWLRT